MLPENAPYLEAFVVLSPDRPVYFLGEGHIPVPSILAYAVIRDLDADELLRRMRACDAAYLPWAQNRREEKGAIEKRARGSHDRPRRPEQR